MNARVTLIGCGALGTAIADTLVRAGVGFLRICDRDFPEPNNLQRQVLFDEKDVAANIPKAEAARRKLAHINSLVTVEAMVTDVNPTNIRRCCQGADLIMDGTDNFETRYLINDWAIKESVPWVYGAVVGSTAVCMPVVPGRTLCLRCIFDAPPPAELSPTCDTAGVIAPAVAVAAGLQCAEALKILSGRPEAINAKMVHVDVWEGHIARIQAARTEDSPDCVCCVQRRFEYLDGNLGSTATHLCGRNAVQIHRTGDRTVDFGIVAAQLGPVAEEPVTHNAFLLRAKIDGHLLTLFRDGRAIIQGTDDVERARTLYAKYIGS